jgi:deoxyribonuclease V
MPEAPHNLHSWDLTPAQARNLQTQLAARVVDDVPLAQAQPDLVAGVDVSVRAGLATAAIVVMAFPALNPVETATATQPLAYPYIPGLLSFREMPVILAAYAQLRTRPGVFLVDGMGRIHPRRFGLACHLGLWLDAVSIGCGKTHYLGNYDEPGRARGARSSVLDAGEVIGAVLRTRDGVRPLYVSVGHRIDLASAIDMVMATTTRYRLPEPIRAAHRAAGAAGT